MAGPSLPTSKPKQAPGPSEPQLCPYQPPYTSSRHLGPLSQLPWDLAPLTSGLTQASGHPGPHSQLYQESASPTSGLTPALRLLGPATRGSRARICQWAATSLSTWLHPLVGRHQSQEHLDPNPTYQQVDTGFRTTAGLSQHTSRPTPAPAPLQPWLCPAAGQFQL